MNLIFIGRKRWGTACTVYGLAIYVLAVVVDGRCALRLKSVLKLYKYNQFRLKWVNSVECFEAKFDFRKKNKKTPLNQWYLSVLWKHAWPRPQRDLLAQAERTSVQSLQIKMLHMLWVQKDCTQCLEEAFLKDSCLCWWSCSFSTGCLAHALYFSKTLIIIIHIKLSYWFNMYVTKAPTNLSKI